MGGMIMINSSPASIPTDTLHYLNKTEEHNLIYYPTPPGSYATYTPPSWNDAGSMPTTLYIQSTKLLKLTGE